MRRRRRRQRTPEQQRRRASRGQRVFRAIGRTLFFGVLLVAAVLAMTVFFKVNTIAVEGAEHYTPEEVTAALDIREGDNLYLWNKTRVIESLQQELPYLQAVQIRRRLPDTLAVTVTECKAAVAVQNGMSYIYVSEQGKVLEESTSDSAIATVSGVTIEGVSPGQMLPRAQDAQIDALLEALDCLRTEDMLAGLRFVNLQDLTDVRIGYEGRFDIRIGTMDELDYRLRFAKTVVQGQLSPTDTGILYWDAEKRLHFVPDTAENVARSATQSGEESSLPVDLTQSGQSADEEGSSPEGEGAGQTGDPAEQDGTEQIDGASAREDTVFSEDGGAGDGAADEEDAAA